MARKITMSSLLLLCGSSVLLAGIANASEPDLAAYPLHVQILKADWQHSAWGTSGYGKGNLQEAGRLQGFDYTYNCPEPFLATEGNERYLARWKTVGSKLSILTHPVGNANKHSECELKVTLHSFAFALQNGQLVTISAQAMSEQRAASVQLQHELNPTDTNLSHFPLKIFLLAVDWGPRTAAGYLGSGRGNVQDGDKINAMDFGIACPAKLLPSLEGHFLHGAWDGDNKRIIVLTHKVEDPAITHQCELKVTVNTNVYVMQPSGSIAALTQGQYAAQGNGQPSPTTSPQ
jgi:hypothetical protein